MSNKQEDQLLRKRLVELANRSYMQGIYTNTNFLDMTQLAIVAQMEKEFSQTPFFCYGGVEGCQRMVIRFGSLESVGYEVPFSIACIHITPLMKKFAQQLTHRDYLGAIMNLGIERDQIGDIIAKEKEAYFFCLESIAEYIMEHLTKIKHTNIRCEYARDIPTDQLFVLEYEEILIASERIDGFVAKLVKESRSHVSVIFQEKKVFVNGRLCENHSYQMKKEDVIVVRGYGKVIYKGIQTQTKKDKLRVGYERYC
ncbi:MAG: YlmH/Sll1252 family protein [Eubacteriales bacterium]